MLFRSILYKGQKIYTNLSMEDCTEVLQDFSERFYSEETIELEFIELEEI